MLVIIAYLQLFSGRGAVSANLVCFVHCYNQIQQVRFVVFLLDLHERPEQLGRASHGHDNSGPSNITHGITCTRTTHTAVTHNISIDLYYDMELHGAQIN